MENEILQRLQVIESRYKRMRRLFWGFIGLSVIGIASLGFTNIEKFGIIRAKGIIIEDENGRDRVLIGAPIPHSKDRVRTDTAKVRKHFASLFKDPNEYMGWYKKYKNSSNGIVFMNDKGFDEVLVGEDLADPNVGVRMFKVSGLLVNNKEGWERIGAGVNTLENGKTRQGFGVDDDSGEAMHIVTLEDGSKAIILSDEKGSIKIGMAKKEGELFQNKGSFAGIKYFNNEGKLIWEQKMDTAKKR